MNKLILYFKLLLKKLIIRDFFIYNIIGFNKSTSDTKAYLESYTNSAIENKNGSINIRTKNTNDADKGNVSVIGANIDGKDINIDVANNLIVESLQNKEYSNTKSENYGGTVGNSLGGFSANYGNGFDKKERNWVDNQTSIIGNNSVVINTKNNTNIKGVIIASGSYNDNGDFVDNNNLSLDTKTLTYSDIYDNDTEKRQNIGAGIGTTVSFNYSNGGKNKEQITRATIGNGNIVIADNNDISSLNRNVNKSQEITKSENTGGWNVDVSVNIPGLIELSQDGFDKFTDKKLHEAKVNTIELAEKTDKVVESVYKASESVGETLGGDAGKTIFGGLARLALGSTIGGVASAFGETNSKIIVADKDANGNILKDEKGNTITKTITREELASGDYKNYEVLGIMSGEKGAIAEINLKPNTAERTNPTDGFFGDLIESGLGKVFNALDASDMMAMSREVAADLNELSKNPSNTTIKNANFHSQGTIIEQGALQIYKKPYLDANGKLTSLQQQTPLNSNIKYNSLGYAVYEDTIRGLYKDLGVNSDINDPDNNKVNFDRDEKDSVQQLTSPKSVSDFINGWRNIFKIDTHSINNSRYDKYYDSVDLIERSKIDMNRYGGKENTDYNLVSPDNTNNNNKANYVIPSYIRANDK